MTFRHYWLPVLAALCVTSVTAKAQLSGVVTEDGQISISVDANGNNDGTGLIQVEKPDDDATVRGAYCAAASFDFRTIADGDVSIEGNPIAWDLDVFNNAGSILDYYHNTFADVTSIIAPILDPLAAGSHDITVTEVATTSIDGVILMVVFDDPSAEASGGVVILFGGQDTLGDQFIVSLAQALDLDDPDVIADMGLGISFGFQGDLGTDMISEIDVNGSRLTSSAGGEDDGGQFNGGLITVGGLGDTNDNPPPFDPPDNFRFDDELYNLLPFVTDGDTQIIVDTVNPTDDDNIFFGYFITTVPISVEPETIFIAPLSADLALGCDHSVVATVLDAGSMTPIVGRDVDFLVVSGPNAGANGTDTTDSNGEAFFSYTGSGGAGTDEIVASMINGGGDAQESNTATADWNVLLATQYCFGDGCPCGNDDLTAGCLNSSGAGALMSASGTSSVLADDLVLTTTSVPLNQWGIYYMGGGMVELPFGGGKRCVGPGKPAALFRYDKQRADTGSMSMGPGIVAISQNFQPDGRIAACQTWNFQAWFRDRISASCGSGYNLSNAVSVTFGP